jgi:hypothetical protein
VRCQSEALAHHASTLAAARRAVNRKSELNELRAFVAARRRRKMRNGHAAKGRPEIEALIA